MIPDAETHMQMLFSLRKRGVSDPAILEAIEKTPRDYFVEHTFAAQAYQDTALPIRCGQTISQPSIVAYMTQALEVTPRCKVLEIGTGSGYQAAILSRLARRVYTVERHPELAAIAKQRFEDLGLYNITTRLSDGGFGWPEQEPFDRIMITAAAEDVPKSLVSQLRSGGIMVLPVGDVEDGQKLVKIVKQGEDVQYTEMIPVRFVPLVAGLAENP